VATRRALIISALALLIPWAGGCSDGEPQATDDTHQAVTIKGETFNLELALDEDTRIQGLSDRAEIAPDGGMLFVFPDEQRRAFVMRRCLVPIDIAFLDAQGEVLWMHAMQVEPDPNAPDNRLKPYDSHHPAQFAIELRDGTLRRLGLRQGDRIDLPLDDLKRRAR
jgi:uncharacterized protein